MNTRHTSTDVMSPQLRLVTPDATSLQPDAKRVLIVGCGSGGRYIARELREVERLNFIPIGFVDDDETKKGRRVDRLPVFGGCTSIPEIVRRKRIAVIILALPSVGQERLSEIATIAKSTGAKVIVLPSFETMVKGVERAESLQKLSMTDVLGRPIVEPDLQRCRAFIGNKRVLITGAAGSIGQELAYQVTALAPAEAILFDMNESGLFDLEQRLNRDLPEVRTTSIVGSVTDVQRLDTVFDTFNPDIVFHAAAYKHVPLMEKYPGEAVRTNAHGTRNVALAAATHGTRRFVLVSTDKAVRPVNVMGATKRLAEILLADISLRTGLSSCSVRFGNVLGSRGSVIPTFERQIECGGPVTVTDARMRRYFMTIPEAANLIIQSGAFGERDVICILDMGEDVSILDLAKRVIELHGLRPYVDIPIAFTGIRKGEKLREDLSNDFERAKPSQHPKIRTVASVNGSIVMEVLDEHLRRIEDLDRHGRSADIRTKLLELVAKIDNRLESNGHFPNHHVDSFSAAGDR